MRLRLRNPKKAKSQHSIQFVETKDWMCPIGAYKALVNSLGRRRSNLTPFCETADGSLVRGRWIKKLLKTILAGNACYLGGKLSSHSFRAGLATALARVGVKEAQIKMMGHWKSGAFNLVKRGRVGNIRAQTYSVLKVMSICRL